VDEGAAGALLIERWGLVGPVRSLGSHEDENFLVEAPEGRFVLKVTAPSTSAAEVDAQAVGLAALGAAGVPFDVPTLRPALDGAERVDLDGGWIARVLTFVEGTQLAEWSHLPASTLRAFGGVAARTLVALRAVPIDAHPGLRRDFTWDSRRTPDVVRELAPSIANRARRRQLLEQADAVEAGLAPVVGRLREATVHGDVTDLNVVCRRGADGRPEPTGLIDLGDLSVGWVVGELAVAAVAAASHARNRTVQAIAEVAAGFDEVVALDDDELAALWWVVLGRIAVLAAGCEHQALLDPANEYVGMEVEREWATFRRLARVPPELAHEAVRLRLGRGPSRSAPPVPLAAVSLLDTPVGEVIDVSITSDLLPPGAWTDPAEVARVVAGAGPAAVGRHGERRPDTQPPSQREPDTVTTGVGLTAPVGAVVRAPLGAVVRSVGAASVVLAAEHTPLDIVIRGVVPTVAVGEHLAAGTPLGKVFDPAPWPPHLHVVATAPGLRPPHHVPGSLADAWLLLCPDPSPLLGLPPGTAVAPKPDPAALLARREAVLAGVQEHYWASPPVIERGWRSWLYDSNGRALIDAVNNVAVLGHSHPGVAAAVDRALRQLNANSRFHYEAIVAYAERLTALLPDPLDTVFLVSTGSEACDLALRLVRTATGREDVLALQGAYHGWTMATDAVSTSLFDNPSSLGTRPPWVHLVEAPNTYRGRFRGPDAGARYAEDVARALGEVASAGHGPAGFIAEPMSGNAGGIVLPDGYLASAYEQVRAAGGLCIADEVQTGLGRLGDWFWAFESQGVVPDVVTVAKATGNGVPVGAVITTRAIADAFAANGSFFSSVGGSPMAAAAGIAVLDAIEAEGLQANAREVGAHLRAGLEGMVERFDICGAVHGHGLYLGLELVRDGDTLEPAGAEAAAICERALELGVVIQPTGDGANVLKIKPPLCFTDEDAAHLVGVLARIFEEGW
jgi:4-aminobutyrate aminotransferase-like enzyme/Ser/Thr protein kinase RdoA (MazF antagonist)